MDGITELNGTNLESLAGIRVPALSLYIEKSKQLHSITVILTPSRERRIVTMES